MKRDGSAVLLLVAVLLLLVPAPSILAQASPAEAAPVQPCPELARVFSAAVANDQRVSNFANLNRYREANRTVANAQVVFIGDSITDSWQQAQFGTFFSQKGRVNRGISGQTTPQMLLRFRADVLNLKPKVVVILAGTNDIAGNTGPMTNDEIEGNIASMCELATVAGIRVVLSSILPVSAYHPTRGVPQTIQRPMPRILALNEWLRRYAATHGHVYLDYFAAVIDQSGMLRAEYSEDDLHPNKAGYEAMAPLAEAAIAAALKGGAGR
jgi:lysophospholipase L1-like esterase